MFEVPPAGWGIVQQADWPGSTEEGWPADTQQLQCPDMHGTLYDNSYCSANAVLLVLCLRFDHHKHLNESKATPVLLGAQVHSCVCLEPCSWPGIN